MVGNSGGEAEDTGVLPAVELQSGAAASFDGLFDTYFARAVRLAWLLAPSAGSAAEDAAADALAKVWPKWTKGEVDDFWPYLRVAVCNEVRMRGRRFSVAARFTAARDRDTETAFDAGVVNRAVLADALRALPDRQRSAVVLRYYEDLSEAATAKVMRCSLGTVKSTTARGLLALRTILERASDNE
jgi:RNA polymerase sigma factor (sigma-70 family)